MRATSPLDGAAFYHLKNSPQEIEGYVSALMENAFGHIQYLGAAVMVFMYGYASWILKIHGCKQLTFWIVLLWILLMDEIAFYAIKILVEKGIYTYEDEFVYYGEKQGGRRDEN